MQTDGSLDLVMLSIGLVGGLALFLYGLDKLTGALKRLAGGRLQTVLAQLTSNRFKAAAAGAFATAVLQSSSVTTVLVVGFVSAGLMTLSQSIGMIMGANVGSTVTAQIVAFDVTRYALAVVAAGFAAASFGRRERVRQTGAIVMGLGLVFFGMEVMKTATGPLRSHEPFVAAMHGMTTPGWTILIGAGITALIQSSAATMGLVIVFASQGFLTLETGILLVLGANVGTCVTALLASIGKRREALRAAAVHVLFNVAGVLLWVWLVPQLADAVRFLSPSGEELQGMARLASETPRQIANAHTLFNVVNMLVFIGFTGPIARLVARLIPDRHRDGEEGIRPKYLDASLMNTPGLALDRIRMELRRAGDRAHRMVEDAFEVVLSGTPDDLTDLAARDDDIDTLHDAIVDYARRLSQLDLGDATVRRLDAYVTAANHVESIGDMVQTNLVASGRDRIDRGLHPSGGTRDLLRELHERVAWAVRMAMEALDASNPEMAERVIASKEELNRIADEAEEHLGERLSAEEGDRLPLFKLETEVTQALRHIFYFARRIAGLVERPDGGSPASERGDSA